MVKPYNFGQPPRFFNALLKDFAGVDFSSYPSDVVVNRSPESLNMVSTKNGIIEKRTGYGLYSTLPTTDVGDEELNFNYVIYSMYRSLYTYRLTRWTDPSLRASLWESYYMDVEIVQRGNYFF